MLAICIFIPWYHCLSWHKISKLSSQIIITSNKIRRNNTSSHRAKQNILSRVRKKRVIDLALYDKKYIQKA